MQWGLIRFLLATAILVLMELHEISTSENVSLLLSVSSENQAIFSALIITPIKDPVLSETNNLESHFGMNYACC